MKEIGGKRYPCLIHVLVSRVEAAGGCFNLKLPLRLRSHMLIEQLTLIMGLGMKHGVLGTPHEM